MSSVSSMVITCALIEEEDDGGLPALHEWCASHEPRRIRFGTLNDDPAVCNAKAMQAHILACAANYFDEVALIEAFPTFPWLFPDEAVLVIHPEEGEARIVRGDGRALDGEAAEPSSEPTQQDAERGIIATERGYRLRAEAAIERVRALHRKCVLATGQTFCSYCLSDDGATDRLVSWPCPTIAALDGGS